MNLESNGKFLTFTIVVHLLLWLIGGRIDNQRFNFIHLLLFVKESMIAI